MKKHKLRMKKTKSILTRNKIKNVDEDKALEIKNI